MEEWITLELETTELGDARRTKRLIEIVENLSAKPEASVPVASGTWAEFYPLFKGVAAGVLILTEPY